MSSVREKTPQCERKDFPLWEEETLCVGEHISVVVIWVILYSHEKHLQNAAKWLFVYDENIGKKMRYNLHILRGLWIRNEEMPFLHQEEAFLASRRACSRMLKGMFLSVERRKQDWRGTKKVYTFGACGKRGQCGATDWKDWDSWQDTVAKIVGKSGADSRKERDSWQERLTLTARNRGGDGRKGGARMGKTIGRKQGEEDVKSW